MRVCPKCGSKNIKLVHLSHILRDDKFQCNVCGYEWRACVPERKTFGISLSGIKVKKEEFSIDPKRLEPNIFYLFSYKGKKYAARKSDNNVVEIYEVLE